MPSAQIAIIGGGVSGLFAAHLLQAAGCNDFVVIEARDTLGGRIMSVNAHGHKQEDGGFDLGAAWFWPQQQRQLQRVVQGLQLQSFEQFEAGDALLERSTDATPVRLKGGDDDAVTSMRLVGGMGALIGALRKTVDLARIVTGQAVRRMRAVESCVELDTEDAANRVTTWRAEHVLFALPPRLVENSIEFEPPLPQPLAKQWRATPTWMAPHAKYIAVYDTPFWRDQGLSGEAQSGHGPMVEIHDASMPGGHAALFGFLGVSARMRRNMSEDELRAQCRTQFERLFGPQAAIPRAEVLKDWSQDPFTATAADLDATGHHGSAPTATVSSGPWHGLLTGIASEWSPHFPGYIAGAIEAAGVGVQPLIDRILEAPTASESKSAAALSSPGS